LVLLVIEALLGRERDRGVRALLSVTVCSIVVVCAQVGFFAARFAPHLLGRDLASLPPVLFLVFALWLSRGLLRRRTVAIVSCFGVLALLALAPWNDLVASVALPDSFGIALTYRLAATVKPADLVTLTSLGLLVVFVFIPRRAAVVLPALMVALLAASSVVASNVIVTRAGSDQYTLIGYPRDWIDRAVSSDVTYLYEGDGLWNSVWQQRFWNTRIAHVLSFPPLSVPGPMPQREQAPTRDGRVPIKDHYAVASDRITFFGTPIAHDSRGPNLESLTLWHLDEPARLSMATTGILPNGDMTGPGTIAVYDCAGGTLDLTLLPKATDVVTVSLGNRRVLRQRIAGLKFWQGSIPVPASHRGTCVFTIRGGLLLGSTVRTFERG
jgi:hypothetical protein